MTRRIGRLIRSGAGHIYPAFGADAADVACQVVATFLTMTRWNASISPPQVKGWDGDENKGYPQWQGTDKARGPKTSPIPPTWQPFHLLPRRTSVPTHILLRTRTESETTEAAPRNGHAKAARSDIVPRPEQGNHPCNDNQQRHDQSCPLEYSPSSSQSSHVDILALRDVTQLTATRPRAALTSQHHITDCSLRSVPYMGATSTVEI